MKVKNMSLFYFFIFFSCTASASDFHSPRTAALSGAGHAGPLLNDALYLNPSFTSFLPTYSLSTAYTRGYSEDKLGVPADRSIAGLSIQDGRTEWFQAGIGVLRRFPVTALHFGASKSIFTKYGVGAGIKWFMDSESKVNVQDLTLSASGLMLEWLQLAVIVDNALENHVAKNVFGLEREIILGTKLNLMNMMLFYIDPHWTPELEDTTRRFGIEAGLELVLFTDFYLRFGTYRNARSPIQNIRSYEGWSTGLGWLGPKLSFDYAFSKQSAPVDGYAHSLGLTLYF